MVSNGIFNRLSLIIVDIQNDFIDGSLGVDKHFDRPITPKIISNINNISKLFETVVYTRDWHPENHISFLENHDIWKNKSVDSELVMGNYYQLKNSDGKIIELRLWPKHCVQNHSGAEFPKSLNFVNNAIVIDKGIIADTETYSGFGFDNPPKSITPLAKILKEKNIVANFICGLVTHICVKATCIDSLKEGAVTFLILDCSGTFDQIAEKETLVELKSQGAIVTSSKKIEEIFQMRNDKMEINELITSLIIH